MRPEALPQPISNVVLLDSIAGLNLRLGEAAPEDVLQGVLGEFPEDVALVSSFGAEAAVLLHVASRVNPDIPVLMVDTLMLFEETLAYQLELSQHLGLRNVKQLRPDHRDLARADPANDLHLRNADACCVIRKVAPLERALEGWSVVVSGRKRFQASTRSSLNVFETDEGKLRVNPLATWTPVDIRNYMSRHNLPQHPLVSRGFPSIGCAPCTTSVAAGEDARAGRWRGSQKVECGIHFGADGTVMRKAG